MMMHGACSKRKPAKNSLHLIQKFYTTRRILRHCAGLPLALVTVGKAMRTKKTAQQWEYVANMMRKSKYPSIPGIKKESNFFPVLKISYDNLESDTLKQCFLYCSLWAEDELIYHDSLIECWMGHGLLNDFDEAYKKGDFLIGILKEACLLESGKDEFSDGNFVKLHDVIRDLALWITSDSGGNKQAWLVKPNANLERLPQDIPDDRDVINLSGNNITALDGFPNNCHKLKTLILSANKQLNLISMEFFMKMRCLKYLDLQLTKITTLPEDIGMLIELEYLNLSRTHLECLPMALGDLKNLKYLYCNGCTRIKGIPCGLIARLTKLQILDLYEIGFYFSEEGAYVDELLSLSSQLKAVGINIQGLSTLKRVSSLPKKHLEVLTNKDEDNIYNDNSNLTTSISISPSLLGSNSKTSLRDLRICKIPSLQELVMTTESDPSSWCLSHLDFLSLMQLPQLSNVIWKELKTCYFLPRLRFLFIEECNSLTSLCWTAHLPLLRDLYIERCAELKSIINVADAGDHKTLFIQEDIIPFKSLDTLFLLDNPNLECIYEEELSFPSLEVINLTRCSKLTKLPLALDSAKKLKTIAVEPLDAWDNMDWPHKDRFSHLVPYYDDY